MSLRTLLEKKAEMLRAQAREGVDAARSQGAGSKGAGAEILEIPTAELLEQVKAGAEIQAGKFVGAAGENADLKPSPEPPVKPADASIKMGVEVPQPAPAGSSEGKIITGRRRRRGGERAGGKPGTPAPDHHAGPEPSKSPVEIVPSGVSVPALSTSTATTETSPKPPIEIQPEISALTDAVREPVEIIPEQPAEMISGESKGETPDQKIARLKGEAESLRMEYVKADYDETNAWARVRNFFGKTFSPGGEREWQEKKYHEKQNYRDGLYWQAQYQNILIDLKSAQLEQIKRRAGDGTGWKKEMADMIRYFDLDEPMDLASARTEYRAGKQNWPTKVSDAFGALGRNYNRLSMKEKLAIAAACAGGTIALTLSGGAAAGAMAGLIVGGKRFLASAGLAVSTEALLDSSRIRYQTKETEKEIERLFEETPEKGFDYLEAEIKKKAFAIDDRLQKAKLTKLLHKAGALTAGVVIGSGWLTQIAMDKWGGHEAVDRIKERFHEMVSGLQGIGATETTPTSDVPIALHDAAETAGAAAADIGVQAATEAQAGLINAFVSQEIRVAQGDSVWKIGGRLADQLGLEGVQKTYFVDALKDKFGDVLLQEGETVNLAQHGIDQKFVETALHDARTLTSAQSIAIEANDARIAEYARANPEVILTDGVTQNIVEAPSATPDTFGSEALSAETGRPGSEAIGIEGVARGTAPELAALYSARADDWYQQIFRMENASFGQDWMIDREKIGGMKLHDILQDARLFQQGAFSGYTTGLDREQIINFAEFFQGVSKSDIGFDRRAFFRNNPHATVMDYLNEVAPLAKQGQRIGLYTTQ